MSRFPALPRSSAILFDLDGTIIDSRAGIIATIHRVIETLGHTPDLAVDLTWVVGPPLPDLIGEVLSHYGETRVEKAIALYRALYPEIGVPATPVFPHMAAYLEALATSDAQVYLATSKPAGLARDILDRHGLSHYFDAICGARPDDTGAEKPEMIAGLLRDHALDTKRSVMIGDRKFDINGAHANKLRALGVLWGYGGETELTDAGADMLVSEPADLPDAVAQQLERALQHA